MREKKLAHVFDHTELCFRGISSLWDLLLCQGCGKGFSETPSYHQTNLKSDLGYGTVGRTSKAWPLSCPPNAFPPDCKITTGMLGDTTNTAFTEYIETCRRIDN